MATWNYAPITLGEETAFPKESRSFCKPYVSNGTRPRLIGTKPSIIQTIETVEQEVERLLQEDQAATEVKFGS